MQARAMLLASFAIIASFANAESARTLAFPARPVRIVVGYPPGGVADIVARLMGHWLSERLGQPFVIENRAGAASNIATEAVVRAPGDGYTLLLVNPANAISATLYGNLNFNFNYFYRLSLFHDVSDEVFYNLGYHSGRGFGLDCSRRPRKEKRRKK